METFNFFKNPVKFYFQGKSQHSHWSGILGSFFFFGIFVVALVFFGMDFYLRENPIINTFSQDLADFTAVLPEIDHNPKVIIGLEKEISSQIQIIFFDFKGKYSDQKRACTQEELQGKINTQPFLDYFCIYLSKLNFKLGIQRFLAVMHCSDTNLKKTPIYNSLNLEQCTLVTAAKREKLFEYFVRIYYSATNLRMNQYNNPISYSYNEYVTGFLEKRLATYVLSSQIVSVLDDKGWIFSSKNNSLALDSGFYLESMIKKESFELRINLRFEDSVEVNKRIYMKAQNLAATLGGFLKALLLVIKVPLDFICKESLNANYIQEFMTNSEESSKVLVDKHKKLNSTDRASLNTNKTEEIKRETINRQKQKITLKFLFFRLIPCRSKSNELTSALEGAQRLFKRVISVEHLFRSFFEFEVFKKILLCSEERQLLKIIRNPSVFDLNCSISRHYLKKNTCLKEEQKQIQSKQERLLEHTSCKFRETIAEYI